MFHQDCPSHSSATLKRIARNQAWSAGILVAALVIIKRSSLVYGQRIRYKVEQTQIKTLATKFGTFLRTFLNCKNQNRALSSQNYYLDKMN